jgi:hypothetical protein
MDPTLLLLAAPVLVFGEMKAVSAVNFSYLPFTYV